MSLSKQAEKILRDPFKMLHLSHNSKSPIKPERIYESISIDDLDLSSYVKALKEIRQLASRRGIEPKKKPVQDALYSYTKDLVYNKKMVFRSLNQLNTHLKGLWGSELPKKYRSEFQEYFRKQPSEDVVLESNKTTEDSISLNIEGLSLNLSKGSSLTIGQLNTKTLDFKGLRSVSIEKVEGGCLYGVSLET